MQSAESLTSSSSSHSSPIIQPFEFCFVQSHNQWFSLPRMHRVLKDPPGDCIYFLAPFSFSGPCVIIGVGLKICGEPPAKTVFKSRSHKVRPGSPILAYATEIINCVFLYFQRIHGSAYEPSGFVF